MTTTTITANNIPSTQNVLRSKRAERRSATSAQIALLSALAWGGWLALLLVA